MTKLGIILAESTEDVLTEADIKRINAAIKKRKAHEAMLRDTKLSMEARGVLAYLHTNKVGWQIVPSDLQKVSRKGRDAVRRILKELQVHGYISRRCVQVADGKFEWPSLVYLTPIPKEERTVNNYKINWDAVAEDGTIDYKNIYAGKINKGNSEGVDVVETEEELLNRIMRGGENRETVDWKPVDGSLGHLTSSKETSVPAGPRREGIAKSAIPLQTDGLLGGAEKTTSKEKSGSEQQQPNRTMDSNGTTDEEILDELFGEGNDKTAQNRTDKEVSNRTKENKETSNYRKKPKRKRSKKNTLLGQRSEAALQARTAEARRAAALEYIYSDLGEGEFHSERARMLDAVTWRVVDVLGEVFNVTKESSMAVQWWNPIASVYEMVQLECGLWRDDGGVVYHPFVCSMVVKLFDAARKENIKSAEPVKTKAAISYIHMIGGSGGVFERRLAEKLKLARQAGELDKVMTGRVIEK